MCTAVELKTVVKFIEVASIAGPSERPVLVSPWAGKPLGLSSDNFGMVRPVDRARSAISSRLPTNSLCRMED